MMEIEKMEIEKQIDARAVALDTLKTLDEFIVYLSDYSMKVGRLFETRSLYDAHEEMIRLVDGIGTFHESVVMSRAALKLPDDAESVLLEADFKSILEDLADFHEKAQYDYVAELLRSHLPANLAEWREEALPKMIGSALNP